MTMTSTTEQSKQLRSFGKKANATTTFTPRKQGQQQKPKREFKDYKDYVYVGQQEVDTTTLVPLTKEDTDYNAKLKEVIEVGKEYKYKDLCELLGETYQKGGTAKQTQLATWYQNMEWEHPISKRTGKSSPSTFKVITIYDTPRPKINQTYELKHFKKQQLECNFICYILSDNNLHKEVKDYGLVTGIKANKLYERIGLVNDIYYLVRSNKEAIADFLPIENQIEVFSGIDNDNKKFATGALNRLKRAKVIEFFYYTYIWTDTNRKEHLATDEEHLAIEKGIKEMVRYANEEVGLEVKSIADLFNGKIKKFVAEDLYDYMIEFIKEEIPTIHYFSRAYKVVYLKDNMREHLEKVGAELGISLEDIQSIKLLESRKEHSEIQVGKAMNRNQSQPITQDKEARLTNVVINEPSANPLTEQEIQQKEDTCFIIERATVSDYIKSLAIDDINKILEDTVGKYEQEQLDKLLDEAISYCYMPITIYPEKKRTDFIELNNYLDKYNKLDSLYIRCNVATNKSMQVTLHINHTNSENKKKSDRLELMLDSMHDVRNLQAYLVVTHNVKVKVGQYVPKKLAE